VLSASKYIRNGISGTKVAFSKWMDRNELQQVKAVRQKCSELNSHAAPLLEGKMPYFVRSGKLMEKDKSGKFREVMMDNPRDKKNTAPHTVAQVISQPKNGSVGSQVAPS
jgi:hypothetical protein